MKSIVIRVTMRLVSFMVNSDFVSNGWCELGSLMSTRLLSLPIEWLLLFTDMYSLKLTTGWWSADVWKSIVCCWCCVGLCRSGVNSLGSLNRLIWISTPFMKFGAYSGNDVCVRASSILSSCRLSSTCVRVNFCRYSIRVLVGAMWVKCMGKQKRLVQSFVYNSYDCAVLYIVVAAPKKTNFNSS